MKNGEVRNLEARFRIKNGDIFSTLLSALVIELNGSSHIISIIRDITSRRQSEEAVVASKVRYQTLLHTACEGIHVLNNLGQVTEVNDAFCSMLGYTREELLTLNVADWDVQWNGEELLNKIDELISNPAMFETKHRRKDGTIIDVEINAVGVALEGRKYLYAAARDISERKQNEEKIRQLSQAVEQSPVSIVITDTTGAIQYVNPKFVEITGYSREEAMGKNPRILKSGHTSGEEYKHLWEAITAGETWKGELHNKKKN